MARTQVYSPGATGKARPGHLGGGRRRPGWAAEGCGALPHLPSGLLQRREGALRGEPVQAGKEALDQGPGEPERPPSRPGADPEPGTLPSSRCLPASGQANGGGAQRPQAPEGPAARAPRRAVGCWLGTAGFGPGGADGRGRARAHPSGLGPASRTSFLRARRREEEETPRRLAKECAPWGLLAGRWNRDLEEEESLTVTRGGRSRVGGGGGPSGT